MSYRATDPNTVSYEDKLTCYERLPSESHDSFAKFLIYRNMPPTDRTVKKVASQLVEEGDERPFKNIYSSLQNLSAKYHWVDRASLFDADRQVELIKARDAKFYELNEVLLKNVTGIIKYANNLLRDIVVDESSETLNDRIRMSKDVTSLLKDAHVLLCNICGRPSNYNKVDGNLAINADVKHHVPFEDLEKVIIASIKEENE